MLLNLHVKNLAIIKETEVEFTEGLNILSGETGAGKSIVIDSINLALGEKAPKEMIRDNDKPALVELIFQVKEEQLKLLEEMGIEVEDNTVILSRKISKGRSIAKINSETTTVSKMKEVAGVLIDIHGQHEHQSLLHKKKHLEILDDYAKGSLGELKKQLKQAYQIYVTLKKEKDAQGLDSEQRKRELSFLEYELNEIQEAHLKMGEDETLENEYRRLMHGKKIMEALQTAYLQTGSENGGASEQTGRALRELLGVSEYDEKVSDLTQQLQEIDNLMNDFNREISDYLSSNDFDDETYQEVEQRLDLINHLKDKYGDSIEKIYVAAEEKEERIEKLQNYDIYLQQLKEKLNQSEQKVITLAKKISDIRKQAAKGLVRGVQSALQDLNFMDVQFDMHFELLDRVTANGIDDAEFLISTNPGEPMRGLGKVASGGELSRIMLAMKSVLAKNDKIETLIFDEIDTGISGRTAQAVSEKMNVIGQNHQVICITHLPQIAAMADSHFLIEKKVENRETISNITLLSEEESIRELARMLGGVKITDTVLKSAREMKHLAQQKK